MSSYKTFFSNRIHKINLLNEDVQIIERLISDFNKMVYFAYKISYQQDILNIALNKSIHLTVKDRYKYNDYFVGSAVQEAAAILSSQKELHWMHISELEGKLKKRKDKLKGTKSYLTKLKNMLETVIKKSYIKDHMYDCDIYIDKTGSFRVLQDKKVLVLNVYNFEHLYLKPKIIFYENKIKNLKMGIEHTEKKIHKFKNRMSSACFGSKDFFKKQFTEEKYINNHQLWKTEFNYKRNKALQISGRLDATDGNFVFRYKDNKLTIKTESKDISIDGLLFPYGQKLVDFALTNRNLARQPIAWRIENHGDYFIFKVSLDTNFEALFKKNKKFPKKISEQKLSEFGESISNGINHSKVDGVIGFDLNYDHVAWANTNSRGQLLSHGVIKFKLSDNSNKNNNILEDVAIQLIDIAVKHHKPLCGEKLEFSKTKSMEYDNPDKNRKISSFAHNKLNSAIESRAFKKKVHIYRINPAYTSFIGKVKYIPQYNVTVHCAAALVIARRGLNYKEKTPLVLFHQLPARITDRHHWKHWSFLYKELSRIPVKAFKTRWYEKVALPDLRRVFGVLKETRKKTVFNLLRNHQVEEETQAACS